MTRLAAAVIVCSLAATLHAETSSGTLTVTGRVMSDVSGQPIRRAYVVINGPDTRTTRVTMSDLDGTFSFEGLPPDRYRVGASKRPHLSAAVDAVGAPVVIRLPAGAVVTGTVVDQLGRPEPGLL